ncbi:MAG: uracil-DNA glycosylase [Thermoplasmata archaeon]|nr:MAG: uracil-DNA glycosylase [Thermoplasmata archaeon]
MLFKDSLEEIEKEIHNCKKCPLYKNRTRAVPGEGGFKKRIMIIGEAPGKNEDIQGRPFVGKAGELLDRLLGEIGLSRDDVYITNVVKCRPPENREPTDNEIMACKPYLIRQINVLKPKIIVCLGRISSKTISQMFNVRFTSMSNDHGRLFESPIRPIKIFFTYHPAAALYNRIKLRDLEEDFKILNEIIEELEEGVNLSKKKENDHKKRE